MFEPLFSNQRNDWDRRKHDDFDKHHDFVKNAIKLVFVAILVLTGVSFVYIVLSEGNVCDTPLGASDFRCVGYHSQPR